MALLLSIANGIYKYRHPGTESFLGIRLLRVESNSMEDTIMTGAQILVYETPFDKLKEGDIITFERGDGYLNTHRIVNIQNGSITTQGDHLSHADAEQVTESTYRYRVIGIMNWILQLNTAKGVLRYIILPIALVIAAVVAVLLLWKLRKKKKSAKDAPQIEAEGERMVHEQEAKSPWANATGEMEDLSSYSSREAVPEWEDANNNRNLQASHLQQAQQIAPEEDPPSAAAMASNSDDDFFAMLATDPYMPPPYSAAPERVAPAEKEAYDPYTAAAQKAYTPPVYAAAPEKPSPAENPYDRYAPPAGKPSPGQQYRPLRTEAEEPQRPVSPAKPVEARPYSAHPYTEAAAQQGPPYPPPEPPAVKHTPPRRDWRDEVFADVDFEEEDLKRAMEESRRYEAQKHKK